MKRNYIPEHNWMKQSLRNVCITALTVILAFFIQSASIAQSFLHASGTKIMNAGNQQVILKGVGLGGWLLQEGYMLNPGTGGTQWQMKQKLYNQGQTDAQVEAFYQSWRDNFITKADIDFIASKGFNCVRLPMHYELFLTSSQRAVRNSVARNTANYTNYVNSLTTWYNNNQLFTDAGIEGFRIIDNIISWCAANNMYVILDLHAAPGAQGTDSNISDAFVGNDLWNRSIYRDITVRLWTAIANRYKNNAMVAFYDLINEPNNVPSNQSIHDLYERLINAIRATGDTHMLMIEGNGWGNNYDYMEPTTFTNRSNLVYNAHRYGITTSTTTTDPNANQINQIANMINFSNTWNVPVWVGETGENTNDWLSANIAALNSKGIGWCHWTFKRFDTQENAALMHIKTPYLTDGASAMSAVLNNIKFANCVANNNTIAAVAPGTNPIPTCNTVNIPGTVQAESYCTMSGIQTETTTDAGGGQNVGYIETNDWMSYRINVPTTGSYTVQYRVASLSGGGSIRLEKLGGGTTFGTISVPSTGGWQTWTTISQTISLTAGTQDIALVAAAGGFNINWFSISGGTPPPPPPPSGIPYGSYITLKGSNSMFVSSENGTTAMYCNRTTAQAWEKFLVVDAGGGLVALQAGSNGLYVTGSSPMYATSTSIGAAQKFSWISPASGQVELKCSSNNMFVSSENGTAAMNCNRTAAQGWEIFTWATSTKSTADVFANSNPDNMLSIKSTLVIDQLELTNNFAGRLNIKIVDLSGRLLIDKDLETGYNVINVSSLKGGIYIIHIADGPGSKTFKFIKE